jgi:branched-chain amino acid transport system substrate-binding protein
MDRLSERSGVGRGVGVGLLLLVVLGASACWPRPVPEVLKIGLSAPFEGRYRAIGYDAIYAARLAIREINERDPLPGYRLALVAYDDRADVAMARANAEALITDPAVVAVIGHYRQETTGAAAPLYVEAGVPMVAVGGWVSPTGPGVYHLAPAPERIAEALGQEAAPATSALLGDGPLRAGLSRALPAAAQLAGADAISTTDAVVSLAPPHESAEALRAWRDSGWVGTLIGTTDLGAPSFGQIAGPLAAGTRFVTPYPRPQDLKGADAWIEAYRNVGPHVPEPGYYALPTYEAVYAAAAAIEAVVDSGGDPGQEAVGAALPDVSRTGRLGTIRWDRDGYWAEMPLYRCVWGAAGPECLAREP